jgi:hypothetical protein
MADDPRVGWKIKAWCQEVGGISRATAYRLMDGGEIRTTKIGSVRIILTPPRDFLERHATDAAAQC